MRQGVRERMANENFRGVSAIGFCAVTLGDDDGIVVEYARQRRSKREQEGLSINF